MRVKLGSIVTEASGKLGGQVIQKCRSGLIMRSNESRCKKQSALQFVQRNIHRLVVTTWSLLLQSDRLSWPSNQLNNLSSFAYYTSINSKRLKAGYYLAKNYNVSAMSEPPASFIQYNSSLSIGTGYAMLQANNGEVFCFGGSTQAIMKCTDGQDNWSLVYSITAGKSLYWAIKCSSGTMLTGGGVANTVYRSSDNGANWSVITIGGSMSIVYTGIQLSNGVILVAGAGDNRIWASYDDGLTFSLYCTTPRSTAIYRMLQAKDGSLLLAKFLDCCILRSIDNGLNWSVVFDLSATTPPTVFCTMSNDDIIWKTGSTSTWYRSSNYGVSFNSEVYTAPVVSQFVNGIKAKGIDYASSSSSHYLVYSKDAGKTWLNHILLTYQSYSNAFVVTSAGWLYIAGNTYARPIRASLL